MDEELIVPEEFSKIIVEIRQPEMTKKISTPINPPLIQFGNA